MSGPRRTQVDFDAKMCECGHLYGRHPWHDNPHRHGWCLDCACTQRIDAVAQAEYRRRQVIAADPAHVHGSTSTAYACPGFIPIQLCDECGSPVELSGATDD
jgi:hypothetical protein